MSANTIQQNKQRTRFRDDDLIWLFGYGSLIFKADFPYIARRSATIKGWERRFWQGSHDHRGTAQSPGRVVTLIKSDNAICQGIAYQISARVLNQLDYREKNGYLRFETTLLFEDMSQGQGLVYIATEDNGAFLGPLAEKNIALQIAGSTGPSGANADYLFDLAAALRALNSEDAHVFEIENHLIGLTRSETGNNPG